jgi:pimeloyl-ACP methyl ester carboxylesterase
VKRTLGRVSSPAILVGHSYGGAVITPAGTDDRVAGLVYIAAVAPDAGETVEGQLNQFPTTEIFSHIEVGEGRVWMLPEGVKYFAGDLSEQEQKVVWATHYAPAADLFTQKLDGVAWRSKPSSYIWPRVTAPFIPSSNVSLQSVWAPLPMRSLAVTFPCSPTPT